MAPPWLLSGLKPRSLPRVRTVRRWHKMLKNGSERSSLTAPAVTGPPASWVRDMARDAVGSILPLAAMGFVVLAAIVGGGVELSRAYKAKIRLQSACDAGVLAGRRSVSHSGFDADALVEANTYFASNSGTGNHGATNLRFEPRSSDNGNTVTATASADVPTNYHPSFWIRNDESFGQLLSIDGGWEQRCDHGARYHRLDGMDPGRGRPHQALDAPGCDDGFLRHRRGFHLRRKCARAIGDHGRTPVGNCYSSFRRYLKMNRCRFGSIGLCLSKCTSSVLSRAGRGVAMPRSRKHHRWLALVQGCDDRTWQHRKTGCRTLGQQQGGEQPPAETTTRTGNAPVPTNEVVTKVRLSLRH